MLSPLARIRWIARSVTLPILFLTACQANDGRPQSDADVRAEPAESYEPDGVFARALEAHGGLARWRSFGTLEYDAHKGDKVEHLVVDLQNRHLKLTGDGYTIGFDGKDVWVTPSMDAFSGNPRFYSSLDFYFFALPFVLADPGTIHEPLGTRTIDGRTYEAIKVSFEEGVGDSPDDYYVPYFDPETGTLEVLLYTVTYTSQEPNERFHARTYEWQEVSGLVVPSSMTSYRWNDELMTLGEKRGETTFTDVVFRIERPDASLFAMPDGAAIDPPPTSDQE